MRRVGWILWKEALIEARGTERLPTLGLFSAAVLVTLHFSLPPDSPAARPVAAGFLWAALLFAGILETRRELELERRDGTLDGLRASPMDPAVIFVAKLTSSFVVCGALACALVPLTVLFFGGRASGIPAGIGVALLGVLGLLSWGTLFSVVAGESRSGEVLLPVLLFPLLVPVTISAVRLLAYYVTGADLDSPAWGFVLLGAFDLLALGTSLLLFEYVLDE